MIFIYLTFLFVSPSLLMAQNATENRGEWQTTSPTQLRRAISNPALPKAPNSPGANSPGQIKRSLSQFFSNNPLQEKTPPNLPSNNLQCQRQLQRRSQEIEKLQCEVPRPLPSKGVKRFLENFKDMSKYFSASSSNRAKNQENMKDVDKAITQGIQQLFSLCASSTFGLSPTHMSAECAKVFRSNSAKPPAPLTKEEISYVFSKTIRPAVEKELTNNGFTFTENFHTLLNAPFSNIVKKYSGKSYFEETRQAIKKNIAKESSRLTPILQEVQDFKKKAEDHVIENHLASPATPLSIDPQFVASLEVKNNRAVSIWQENLKNYSASDDLTSLVMNTDRFFKKIKGESPLPPADITDTDLYFFLEQSMKNTIKKISQLYLLRENAAKGKDLQPFLNQINQLDPLLGEKLNCFFHNSPSTAIGPQISFASLEDLTNRSNFIKELQKSNPNAVVSPETQSLIKEKKYQEALWQTAKTNSQQAEKLEQLLKKEIMDKAASITQLPGNTTAGIHESHIISLSNGIRFIYKPFVPNEEIGTRDNNRGEAVAYDIDKILSRNGSQERMVPLSFNASILGRAGSIQLIVENASTVGEMDNQANFEKKSLNPSDIAAKSTALNRLDIILGNDDRIKNIDNLMRLNKNTKKEIAIDNARSFIPYNIANTRFLLKDKESLVPADPLQRKLAIESMTELLENVNKLKQSPGFHDDPQINECSAELIKARTKALIYLLQNPTSNEDLDATFVKPLRDKLPAICK